MGVLMFILYTILGAIALILGFLLLRSFMTSLDQFLQILPEYLWHTLCILLFVGLFVGGIVALIMVV